jgi:hypothetical protein
MAVVDLMAEGGGGSVVQDDYKGVVNIVQQEHNNDGGKRLLVVVMDVTTSGWDINGNGTLGQGSDRTRTYCWNVLLVERWRRRWLVWCRWRC